MATSKMREIEEREGRPLLEILGDLYKKHGDKPATQAAVAKELGISQPTLSQWLLRLRLVQHTVLVPEGEEVTYCTKGGDAA